MLSDRNNREKIFWDNYWKEKIRYNQKYGEIFEIHNKWGYFCNQELHKHYKSLIGSFKNFLTIECGCGSGFNSCLMVREGARATVLDFSPKAIEYAKIVAKRMSTQDEMYFICEDIFAYQANNTFDLAWNCGVIEHYSKQEIIVMVQKMKELVKPGGKIIITIPYWLSPEGIYKLIKKIVWNERISERHITYTYLKKILSLVGLRDIKIVPVNYYLPSCFPAEWADFARKFNITKFIKSLAWLFTGIATANK